jgi:hypothetical protein
MDSETRTLVLMRKDVAPDNWRRSHAELVAHAEAGADGFGLMEQKKTGKQERYWDLSIRVPEDWGAYRKGDGDDGRAFLHIQNYSARKA